MDTKIIIFGFFLVLLGIYGHSADVSGYCDVSATQCDITVNDLELCNNTSSTETYKSFFRGEVAEWFNIVPNIVTLEAGECTDISVFTVANCYADPGTYFSELVIQNDETITLSCEFDLEQGHFVDIEVYPAFQSATQCEEKEYDLIVTNNTIVPNQQIERVDITISGLPDDWYVLEEERILISKDEPETVRLRVQAPCDADFGDYEFTARATLVNPNFYDEDTGTYSLGQGQGIQILLGTGFEDGDLDACLETPNTGEITIVNNGVLDDNLKLTLDGPNFARLDITRLSLSPGEKAVVNVEFEETTEQTGSYDLILKVESILFDYSTQKTFSVELEDCFNLNVIKLEGEEYVCVEDNPIYRFEVTNNKKGTIDLDISIDGISAELDNERMTLEEGESREIRAELDVSKLAREARVTKTDLAVEIIIDTSGSMVQAINGKNKMEIARTSIINLVNNINEIDLGLRVIGQGELCEDSELLVPVKTLDIPAITDKISAMKPLGKTPIAQALSASIDDFPSNKNKAIILVSDGKETCEGNISQTARELAAEKIVVYSVGFDIDEVGQEQLKEISSRTGGKYFDAKNPEQLLEVLQTISKELNINPSTEGKRTFTVKLDSPHFSYEKDFSLTVSDCFNATMVAPELNLCPGVEKSDVITLVNLGSEIQEFDISFSPDWVEGPGSVIVQANSKKIVPFTANPPEGTTIDSYTINAGSDTVELEQVKNINYLSSASCFGIDLIVLEPHLNAATCTGIQQTLIVENRGVITQEVRLSVDKPYVEMIEKSVIVAPGERREVHYFVSPPFDLPETTFITITAETDRGFESSVQIELEVTGNQESFGLGEIDLRIRDLSITEVEGLDYDVEIIFSIYNDSNRTLEVFNAVTLDYNGAVQLDKRFIAAKKTVNARILVDLPEELTGRTVTVPVVLETDEGTYIRNVTFEYKAGEEPQEEEIDEPISIGTGLFSLATISTALLGALIVIVIGLIVFSAYRAVQKEEEKEITKEVKEDNETAAAKAKLNELKKKKEAKTISKEPVKKASKKAAKAKKKAKKK